MLVCFEGDGLRVTLAEEMQCCSQCCGKQKSSGRRSAEIGVRTLKCGYSFHHRKNGKKLDGCLSAQSVIEQQGEEERCETSRTLPVMTGGVSMTRLLGQALRTTQTCLLFLASAASSPSASCPISISGDSLACASQPGLGRTCSDCDFLKGC